MENENHLWDYCQDPRNPVNEDNGGAIGIWRDFLATS
jgi:hypothetical protein